MVKECNLTWGQRVGFLGSHGKQIARTALSLPARSSRQIGRAFC
jgi:hypothetical protein